MIVGSATWIRCSGRMASVHFAAGDGPPRRPYGVSANRLPARLIAFARDRTRAIPCLRRRPLNQDLALAALDSFVQALLKITDVTHLSLERVRSAFMGDFRALCEDFVPEERRTLDWRHAEYDLKGIYTVDCHLCGMPRLLFVHVLDNHLRARDATFSLHQFKTSGLSFRSLAIFEVQGWINRKVLALRRRVRKAVFEPHRQLRSDLALLQ